MDARQLASKLFNIRPGRYEIREDGKTTVAEVERHGGYLYVMRNGQRRHLVSVRIVCGAKFRRISDG